MTSTGSVYSSEVADDARSHVQGWQEKLSAQVDQCASVYKFEGDIDNGADGVSD